tara:strand:+ start:622 stop:1410 length:789 start_codon:yes stop_codon:yes gene_type:complete
MLDFKEFEKICSFKEEMKHVIEISNLAYKNWEICWTRFFPSYIHEEVLKHLSNLSDLSYFVYGGYENADRARIACFRKTIKPEKRDLILSFSARGVYLSGNFLFDNASQDDFRNFLINNGVNKNMIGDIWTLGERGAQGILDASTDIKEQNEYFLRDVEVKIKFLELEELKTPINRIEKLITTVEASIRIDAIASAGFRVSRSKILEKIKSGYIYLNGLRINKSTINLKVGDKITMENKGYIKLLEIDKTKRERWKIKLLKK